MVVDKQKVLSVAARYIAGYANVNIRIPVVVNIHYTDTRAPTGRFEARAFCDIPEMMPSQVQIEPAAALRCPEKKIGQAIVVKIAHANAAAHIGIFVKDQVNRVVFCDGIVKMDAGISGIQLAEKCIRLNILFAGYGKDLTQQQPWNEQPVYILTAGFQN